MKPQRFVALLLACSLVQLTHRPAYGGDSPVESSRRPDIGTSLLLSSTPHGARSEAERGAGDIVDRLQAYYRSLQGYSARFVESSTPPNAAKPLVAEGTVNIRIPSRMRWDYARQGKSDILIDGEKVWFINLQRGEALFWPLEEEKSAPVAYQFLLGVGDLRKSFEMATKPKEGSVWTLDLTPREPLPTVRTISLRITDSPPRIAGMNIEGWMGETIELKFEAFEEKKEFPEDLFRFRPEPGMKIRDGRSLIAPPASEAPTPPKE